MLLAEPDAVIHQLTDLATGDSTSNALLRTVGTRNLVDAAATVGVTRMISASISWVYEPGRDPASESDALDIDAPEPRQTTISGLRSLASATLELPHGVVLRYGQVYGPGTWYARDGRFGVASGTGTLPASDNVVSFVHVDDAVAAAVAALDWPGGVVNVVDDEPASGLEWARVFACAVGETEPATIVSSDLGRPGANMGGPQRDVLRLDGTDGVEAVRFPACARASGPTWAPLLEVAASILSRVEPPTWILHQIVASDRTSDKGPCIAHTPR